MIIPIARKCNLSWADMEFIGPLQLADVALYRTRGNTEQRCK
ncbi:hypothetical protein [Parapedobacter koreensis]|uniref:Uncharacterized protein n=1 Tax=Parapedobacter koreensis TaxID=332977 RepID=A0A1H7UQS4_9SPHI|nr:hypothetical protein [Parapedobacter koreensis]SEL99055.1 hypothetical protein SAMN05421740_12110 [Parapedobacter koreensis]